MLAGEKLPGAPPAFIGFHTALLLAVAAAVGLGRERGRPFGLFAALLIAVPVKAHARASTRVTRAICPLKSYTGFMAILSVRQSAD